MEHKGLSRIATEFHERPTPEPGYLAGYAAIIDGFNLTVPIPEVLSIVSLKHTKYEASAWRVLTVRHTPADSLIGHLTFAMKYEGIELGVLKALFVQLSIDQITQEILKEPNGQYSRKVWFLYEWLIEEKLPIGDLTVGNYFDVVDDTLQYPSNKGVNSKRHRIRNNLPGVRDFCPMIRKTQVLDDYMSLGLQQMANAVMEDANPNLKAQLSPLLAYQESSASYEIEGVQGGNTRAIGWARALAQAGKAPLSKELLLSVQERLIASPRFIKMGYRAKEGFIGEQDRRHGTLLITHFPAKAQDLERLMNGLFQTARGFEDDEAFDAVLATSIISFGFVFIHPFIDGNGRIHRYLFQHFLNRKGFLPKQTPFPVSAVIAERLEKYQDILRHFSYPRISLIDWKPISNDHFEIRSDTVDLYRYFDATAYAEFFYECVEKTITEKLPFELKYLEKYGRMKQFLDDYFEMPDRLVGGLIRLLNDNRRKLRRISNMPDLRQLTEEEIHQIEAKYSEIFMD